MACARQLVGSATAPNGGHPNSPEFYDVHLFQGHRELNDGSAIEVELQAVVHTFTLAREAIASVVKAKVDI